MAKSLRIGTRGSALALAQAEIVRSLLAPALPALSLETSVIRTRGDRNLELSLKSTGSLDKGLFTRELEEALLDGRIDLAVHSLKDLPVRLPEGFRLAAVLRRENPADLLIAKSLPLPADALVATSSPRRARQLASMHPGWRFEEIRGNVPTRLEKLVASPRIDALVLAFAGLARLGLATPTGMPVPGHPATAGLVFQALDGVLPAPGQGAIGIETLDAQTLPPEAVPALHCPLTWACVSAERELLSALGGGCHLALGALARPIGTSSLLLRAVYFSGENESPRRAAVTGPMDRPGELAIRAAAQLSIL